MKTSHLVVMVSMVSMLAGGCASSGDDGSSTSSSRIFRELRLTLHHPTPVFADDRPLLMGRYRTRIDAGTEEVSAELRVDSSFWPGPELRLSAYRDMASAGPGTRYLTEAHFEDFEASLTLEGVEYLGVIETLEFDLDLLYGIAYGTLVLRFEPAEGGGEPVEVGADFKGYIQASCYLDDGSSRPPTALMHVTPGESPPEHWEHAPAGCIALSEALQATPDDPNGPPPPYSLDDTPDDGPAWTPALPPPG